jgi:dTDP-4-dehydrorhamnose reductase
MQLFDSIFIVGDRGMLASAIKSELAARGIRSTTGVDVHNCDITDIAQIEMWFEDVEPTLVINCAAFTNVDACETKAELANAVNGEGAGNLAKVCGENGAKLVHFSTDYVFDGTLRRPLKPDDQVGPQSAYGKSKLLGEQEIAQRARAGEWLIIRTAWLYGPNGPNFPQAMLNAARAGKPLRVVSDQVGSPTYTRDLAEATFDLLDRGASGFWHVSNAGSTNWFEFAGAIFEEFEVTPASFEAITSAEWKAIKPDSAVRPAYSVFDLQPLEALLGRPMPHWRDALRRYRQALDVPAT